MKFMDIITWDPKDSEEVENRFSNWELPEGFTLLGQWHDLSGTRSVMVYEVENAEAYAAGMFPWRDICYFDSFPVMDTAELEKFMSEQMK